MRKDKQAMPKEIKIGRGGFTFLEIVIVMIILGVLTSLAIPRYQVMIEKSRTVEGIKVLSDIHRAQERYSYLANGVYSTNVDDLNLSFSPLAYFENPAVNSAGGTVLNPPNFLGSITRKGDLYTLYITAKSIFSCKKGEGVEVEYCTILGFRKFKDFVEDEGEIPYIPQNEGGENP